MSTLLVPTILLSNRDLSLFHGKIYIVLIAMGVRGKERGKESKVRL